MRKPECCRATEGSRFTLHSVFDPLNVPLYRRHGPAESLFIAPLCDKDARLPMSVSISLKSSTINNWCGCHGTIEHGDSVLGEMSRMPACWRSPIVGVNLGAERRRSSRTPNQMTLPLFLGQPVAGWPRRFGLEGSRRYYRATPHERCPGALAKLGTAAARPPVLCKHEENQRLQVNGAESRQDKQIRSVRL